MYRGEQWCFNVINHGVGRQTTNGDSIGGDTKPDTEFATSDDIDSIASKALCRKELSRPARLHRFALQKDQPDQYIKRAQDRQRVFEDIAEEAGRLDTRGVGDALDHEVGSVADVGHGAK